MDGIVIDLEPLKREPVGNLSERQTFRAPRRNAVMMDFEFRSFRLHRIPLTNAMILPGASYRVNNPRHFSSFSETSCHGLSDR
jgi:hypothetical protein